MRKIRVLILCTVGLLLALLLGSCTMLAGAGARDTEAMLRDNRVDPFDQLHPAIANLDPALRTALQQAAAAARQAGIDDFWVTSGWRTEAYQRELMDQAVAKHGSAAEAAKWVASPTASSHVTGQAVDVGPTDAADWLSRRGQRFGLCQSYANELWHYELSADAQGNCPAMRASAAQ